ncbi:hypothetical protein [Geodermatophilus marinus]|uniref:hypothetical protein n=1 Tax=Geodermatophilus sp. LHW52908 TaxID=2303986 RepID=UPI0011C1C627|nr:hypothetical protein [Geodermatophilus sp. LHW52908]
MTTLLFLLLFLLVLQELGRPAAGSSRPAAASWAEVRHRLATDVLAGARVLSRLGALRRHGHGGPCA